MAVAAPPSAHVKLSVREKLGYSLGDVAANFIFQTLLVFQLAFYTDTFGITAAAAGTLFLVVRISDAFTDPLMGIIADRTETRWGKFRPWILVSAVPFAILAVLTFSTPDFSPTGKLAYAYLTYTMLMVFYTVNNLPYSALSGVMTGDPDERTSISSYRMIAAMAAALVVQSLALPMVSYFGGGDDALGYRITMTVFAGLALVFFVVTFLSTTERVRPVQEERRPVLQDLGDLVRSGPWRAMFAIALFVFVTLSMRGSVMFFYFRYYVVEGSLLGYEMGYEGLFSWFNAYSIAWLVLGIVVANPLAARFGKRAVFGWSLAATAVLTAAFAVIPPDALGVLFGVEAVRNVAYGLTSPLLWAMMGDVADHAEWTTGRRATGMVFAGVVFALKAGLGFGGAISGWVLGAYGYAPNVDQTERALDGIVLLASWFPALTFGLGALCVLGYSIRRSDEVAMAAELEARRALPDAAPAGPVVADPAPAAP